MSSPTITTPPDNNPKSARPRRSKENRIRVRGKRLAEIDETKLSLAYWLLAKRLVEEKTGKSLATPPNTAAPVAETEYKWEQSMTPESWDFAHRNFERPVVPKTFEDDLTTQLKAMKERHDQEFAELLSRLSSKD